MPFTPAHPRRWLGVAAITTTLLAALGTPAAAIPAEAQILHTGGPTAVADSYIVVFKDTAVGKADVAKTARDLAHKHGGTVARTYQHALRGFEARIPEAAAKRLAANPNVKYVEQNHTVRAEAAGDATWGQDRIDQRALPLDTLYSTWLSGIAVKAYVIDTGIRRTHLQFDGRAISGFNSVRLGDGSTADCHGHGTHVAGTIGGVNTGVANGVTLVAVRALDCGNNGDISDVIAGVDWVTEDHTTGQAVASMSFSATPSQSLNDAVAYSIADGITYVAAAGNDNGDACNRSPANLPAVITVGATTNTDARWSPSNSGSTLGSNYGTCLDLFAPGSGILSASYTDDRSWATMSGTSMAAAHVTGAAAMVLQANRSYTPQQVRDYLVTTATNGVVTDPGTGSPNKLLYLGCSNNNDTNVPIADNTTVESEITVFGNGCHGNASPRSTVAVTIAHTNVSDLIVSLIAPDGTPYTLHNRTTAGRTKYDGIKKTYNVDLSSEAMAGTWKLRVQDTATYDVGYIDTWTIDPTASLYCCMGVNYTKVPIPDNTTSSVASGITIAGCSGKAITTSKVEVHIVHTRIGDLAVSLIAPDGTAYMLHNRTGGDTDNIDETYTVDLSSEVANGTWELHVIDMVSQDVGYLDYWELSL